MTDGGFDFDMTEGILDLTDGDYLDLTDGDFDITDGDLVLDRDEILSFAYTYSTVNLLPLKLFLYPFLLLEAVRVPSQFY